MQMNDRERALEDKFAHDEELHFKVRAKRNKLAGLWAAEKLGKASAEASSYADSIVSDMPSKDQLKQKLIADFAAANISISAAEVDAKIDELVVISRRHFMEN
jgi:hypothetical protein